MTRTVFLNFFYGLLYHLTKKQPPLSTSQIMGAVLIVFSRGHYVIIAPLKFYIKIRVNHTDNKQIPKKSGP